MDVGLCLRHKYTHKHAPKNIQTQEKVENRFFFMDVGWGSPTKTLTAPSRSMGTQRTLAI